MGGAFPVLFANTGKRTCPRVWGFSLAMPKLMGLMLAPSCRAHAAESCCSIVKYGVGRVL